jgi:hypothetical protein
VQQALVAWQNFYVIVGSSAGALTGLQFVVVALVANMPDTRPFARTASVFATPTIVHFGAVLVLSGIFSAPWKGIGGPMALVAVAGAVGFAYCTVVARRAHRVEDYKAVMEDWIFHVLLPATAYLTMAIAAAESLKHAEAALFAVAGTALALLVVGIHNAWDSVVYIVTQRIPLEHERNRGRHR